MLYISNINKTGNVRTYNLALRLVHVTTVAVEKQYVSAALIQNIIISQNKTKIFVYVLHIVKHNTIHNTIIFVVF